MPRRSKQLITVIGLGPGDAALLTVEARDALAAAPEVWLRTARHPTTAGLPAGPRYEAFDDLYDTLESFEPSMTRSSRASSVGASVRLGLRMRSPATQWSGKATVRKLLRRAEDERLAVRIISGVSFVDAAATALGVDPLADGLLVLDALEVDGAALLVPQRPDADRAGVR